MVIPVIEFRCVLPKMLSRNVNVRSENCALEVSPVSLNRVGA